MTMGGVWCVVCGDRDRGAWGGADGRWVGKVGEGGRRRGSGCVREGTAGGGVGVAEGRVVGSLVRGTAVWEMGAWLVGGVVRVDIED